LIFRELLTKQITHLYIDIIKPEDYWSKTILNIYELIISLCKKLTVLNFCDMFITRKCLTAVFFLSSTSNICSTLIKLKIKVENLMDCLSLLDGRLESLSTLICSASQIFEPIIDIDEGVSQILMIIFTQNTVNQTNFVFLENTSQIEMFFINCIY